jgi:predicted nicotinamide N-methyase
LYPAILQSFFIGQQRLELFVPDPVIIKEEYSNKQTEAASLYWAKVWPAAIGLCTFLQNNLSYINNKKVLELAAGPGLPGIFCAPYAEQVCISDIEPQAVVLARQSAIHHQLENINCRVIDWNQLPEMLLPDVVLLSDINYEPSQFAQLLSVIHYFLDNQCTVILSSPQRLMAKDFISQLLLFCKEQIVTEVDMDGGKTIISVFVLEKGTGNSY